MKRIRFNNLRAPAGLAFVCALSGVLMFVGPAHSQQAAGSGTQAAAAASGAQSAPPANAQAAATSSAAEQQQSHSVAERSSASQHSPASDRTPALADIFVARRTLARRLGVARGGANVARPESGRDDRNFSARRRRENSRPRIIFARRKAGRNQLLLPPLHARASTVGKIRRDGAETREPRRRESSVRESGEW